MKAELSCVRKGTKSKSQREAEVSSLGFNSPNSNPPQLSNYPDVKLTIAITLTTEQEEKSGKKSMISFKCTNSMLSSFYFCKIHSPFIFFAKR